MNKIQKTAFLIAMLGCIAGWGGTLWLFTRNLQLQMELNAYVRMAGRAKAKESVLEGRRYYLQPTNKATSISEVVGETNGIQIRPFQSLSRSDSLFIQEFNKTISESLANNPHKE